VEDARYQYAFRFNPVKQDMATILHTAQARPNVITCAAQLRRIHELPATGFETVNVNDSLLLTPCVESVGRDAPTGLSQPCEKGDTKPLARFFL